MTTKHPTTESEEMYLITVARAVERGRAAPLPIADVARDLGVSVASANEMVRKLAAKGLVTYEPYRGVGLTPEGEAVAGRVLRIRRLWATFLAERLGFSPADADDQACDLEHVTTEKVAARLAGFLGDPTTGPLGNPIPNGTAPPSGPETVRLRDLGPGETAEVVSARGTDAAQRFLAAEGIGPGVKIVIIAAGESGLLVAVDDREVHVTHGLAAGIETRPL